MKVLTQLGSAGAKLAKTAVATTALAATAPKPALAAGAPPGGQDAITGLSHRPGG